MQKLKKLKPPEEIAKFGKTYGELTKTYDEFFKTYGEF